MMRRVAIGAVLALALAGVAASAPPDLALSTVPALVFLEDLGDGSERWAFRLVAKASPPGGLALEAAELDFYSGDALVRSERIAGAYLEALRGEPLGPIAGVDESFNLMHRGVEPAAARVDRVRYTLTVRVGGSSARATVDVPLERYRARARLLFPLEGELVLLAGHDPGDAHTLERSQQFAYDVVNVGPGGALWRGGSGSRNEDYFGFGRPVLAPEAGTVVRARSDLADNRPGEVPSADFYRAIADREERLAAVAGNVVIVDHGAGEFSVLGHLQRGSVRVRAGDRVARGQVVGRVGNSGNSTAPHLHYHLMDGPLLFRSDGLPATFTNLAPGRLERGSVYKARAAE
jgi:murein DD-endopeptidase MepM/ murein hydrolase activator NlpD